MKLLDVVATWLPFGILPVVALLEYRFGRKRGRFEGYMEGHRHGREDALSDIAALSEGEVAVLQAHVRKVRNICPVKRKSRT